MRCAALLSLVLASLACAPPPEAPTAADAAAYFGLVDGASFTFEGGNVTETHAFDRDTAVAAEREVYRRTVTRGGFVQPDGTMFLEATLDGLFIVRFFDCISECGEPAEPFPVMAFPVEERERLEGEFDVEVTDNGEPVETRTESHAFQASTFAEVTVPAGTFNAVELVWSRDVGGETSTVNLSFVPDVGFVKITNADGAVIEATEVPENQGSEGE
jgi:hypothetical protein